MYVPAEYGLAPPSFNGRDSYLPRPLPHPLPTTSPHPSLSTPPADPSLALTSTHPSNGTHSNGGIKPILRRNQACLQCRRRKLRCDAVRPHCGTCTRSYHHAVRTNSCANPRLECAYDDMEVVNARKAAAQGQGQARDGSEVNANGGPGPGGRGRASKRQRVDGWLDHPHPHPQSRHPHPYPQIHPTLHSHPHAQYYPPLSASDKQAHSGSSGRQTRAGTTTHSRSRSRSRSRERKRERSRSRGFLTNDRVDDRTPGGAAGAAAAAAAAGGDVWRTTTNTSHHSHVKPEINTSSSSLPSQSQVPFTPFMRNVREYDTSTPYPHHQQSSPLAQTLTNRFPPPSAPPTMNTYAAAAPDQTLHDHHIHHQQQQQQQLPHDELAAGQAYPHPAPGGGGSEILGTSGYALPPTVATAGTGTGTGTSPIAAPPPPAQTQTTMGSRWYEPNGGKESDVAAAQLAEIRTLKEQVGTSRFGGCFFWPAPSFWQRTV